MHGGAMAAARVATPTGGCTLRSDAGPPWQFPLAAAGFPPHSTPYQETVMQRISNAVRSFVRQEEGATAVEYGLLVALIAAVIVVTVGLLGNKVNGAFNTVENAIP